MPTVTKDIVADYGAPEDGTSDTRPAMVDMRDDNQGNDVTLNFPTNTYWFEPTGVYLDNFAARGLTSIVVNGNGSTLANQIPQWGNGLQNPSAGYAAKIETTEIGQDYVQITTEDLALASIFSVGDHVFPGDTDLQGSGYPSNLFNYEFARVASVNTDTGVIGLTKPLKRKYRSTLPTYNDDHVTGGEAMLFLADADFGMLVTINDLVYEFIGDGQWYLPSYIVRINDLTNNVPGSGGNPTNSGFLPTGQKRVILRRYTFDNCQMEIDKQVEEFHFYDSTGTNGQLLFQSHTPLHTQIHNVTTGDLNGTPEKFVAVNLNITDYGVLGCLNFGRTNEVTMKDGNFDVECFTGGTLSVARIDEYVGPVAGGIITIPRHQLISNTGSGAGGVVRITVPTTAGYTTGRIAAVGGIVQGTTEANGIWEISVVDGTHIDLIGTTFSNAWQVHINNQYANINAATPPAWAIPGNWCMLASYSGLLSVRGFPFTISDLTCDDVSIFVHTDIAWTTWPDAGDLTEGQNWSIFTHPCKSLTCINMTGTMQMEDWSNPEYRGRPVNSYSKRTYDGSVQNGFPLTLWGEVVSISVNVVTAYTGVQGTLTFTGVTTQATLNETSLSPLVVTVNAKITGERIVLPGSASGSQSGDSGVTACGQRWLQRTFTPAFSADISGEAEGVWPEIVVEVVTDQGFTIKKTYYFKQP